MCIMCLKMSRVSRLARSDPDRSHVYVLDLSSIFNPFPVSAIQRRDEREILLILTL